MTRAEHIELIEEEAADAVARMKALQELVNKTSAAFDNVVDRGELTSVRETIFAMTSSSLTIAAAEIADEIASQERAFACAEESFDASAEDDARNARQDAEADDA